MDNKGSLLVYRFIVLLSIDAGITENANFN